ncbi:MAG: PAS domain-containing protein [Alphaproteobacteria bacterium]|nr:PAS domain-containing protein [Alphaproteobacteria bacterium]
MSAFSADVVLAALPDPILVLDRGDSIAWVNPAAEQFLGAGSTSLRGNTLASLVRADSPLMALVALVRKHGTGLADHGVEVAGPRLGSQRVDVRVSPILESPGGLVVSIRPRSIAESMDRQLSYRGAARSVMGIARLLAHEVKNPLSGISGAAQLLEQNASEADRELTRLIRQEADRICALVDTIDQFGDEGTIQAHPVNIHEVLGHVRKLAQGGFGRHVRFTERYDPSLPPAAADRNALIQVFLNLVKNACEAVPEQGGDVVLATAYRHGVRVNVPGTRERMSLPLEISVLDNGPGVSEEMRAHLFDAFVTSKPGGTGLGLALVAKVIRDLRGVVEFESEPRRTIFRVRLPIYQQNQAPEPGERRHG